MSEKSEAEGGSKTVDERNLFHGTDTLETCRKICTNCFDFRISGKNATVYGEGSYFAVESKYSNSYTARAGSMLMFRAKVLVGKYTKGERSFKRPPEIPGGNLKLYDSCVNDERNPTIFVVFDTNQCYPEYLIQYRKIEAVQSPVVKPAVPPKPTVQDQYGQTFHSQDSILNPVPPKSTANVNYGQPYSNSDAILNQARYTGSSSTAPVYPGQPSPARGQGYSAAGQGQNVLVYPHPAPVQRQDPNVVYGRTDHSQNYPRQGVTSPTVPMTTYRTASGREASAAPGGARKKDDGCVLQ